MILKTSLRLAFVTLVRQPSDVINNVKNDSILVLNIINNQGKSKSSNSYNYTRNLVCKTRTRRTSNASSSSLRLRDSVKISVSSLNCVTRAHKH